MSVKKTRKGRLLLALLGALGGGIYLCNLLVFLAGRGRLYQSVQQVPFNDFGLLLGTAPYLANGRPNRYFVARVEAATELYRAGKVNQLLLSGCARPDGYDEPAVMRAELRKRGIPEEVLIEDRAGIRTFESVVRACHVFGLRRFTIISQGFHNERALFFCDYLRIEALGFNAAGFPLGWKLRTREYLARVVACWDVLLETRLRFMRSVRRAPLRAPSQQRLSEENS